MEEYKYNSDIGPYALKYDDVNNLRKAQYPLYNAFSFHSEINKYKKREEEYAKVRWLMLNRER
ncbi:hypothetical protein [Ruminococcus sp.]|uniref:hypothetical protein n=1 Tax=Ruminococcus sp. TaxID=41978 RepID=UPI0025FD77B0|nr:hypothetical protein [Ruminococcus sp.]MBR1433108.1 hypothetical protein [Ruminococcus sp.]